MERSLGLGIAVLFLLGVTVSPGVLGGGMTVQSGSVVLLDERDISVTTDKNVYGPGEDVCITTTNTGAVDLAGFVYIDFYVVGENYELVLRLGPGDLPDFYELAVGESYTYTWNQTDSGGLRVPDGYFAVKVTFLACCGPLAADYAYFYIHSVVVSSSAGGTSFYATLKNIGDNIAENISWSIDVKGTGGFVLFGGHAAGCIAVMAPGATTTVQSGVFFGFGPVTVTVIVGSVTHVVACFLFGFYFCKIF
jgi:hypothetical protein